MNSSQIYIQSLSSTLFWDVSIMSIDVENHIQFILERVLTRGTLEDFKKTVEFYGKEKTGKTLVKIKTLEKKTLHFCSVYFSIEISQFICYNTKPLNHLHWDY